MIRIIAADDHPAILNAVQRHLEPLKDLQVVAAVKTGGELAQITQEHRPDLLILDLEMEEGFEAAEAVPRLQALHPGLKVLVFSGHDDPERVQEMFRVGADGYAHKVEPLDLLVQAIHAVAAGDSWVSPRLAQVFVEGYWRSAEALPEHERAVLQGVADGEMMEQIARALGVAERTVRGYLHEATASLGVSTKSAAVAEAMRRGLIE